MFLRKKAQSTAEYAITLGLVVALAAGVLQIALKGGIRQKHRQALNVLIEAGNAEGLPTTDATAYTFTQENRETKVLGGAAYDDTSVMKKGGLEKKRQLQTTETNSVAIETMTGTQN